MGLSATGEMLKGAAQIGVGLAVLVLTVVGVGFSGHKLNEMRIADIERQDSRTKETSLATSGSDPVRDDAVKYMTAIPSGSTDGFTYIAMPSFAGRWDAISLSMSPGASTAQGVFTEVTRSSPNEFSRRSYYFAMPGATYAATMKAIDQLVDGWPGDVEGCTDGTPVAFERKRGARITSGVGNDECSRHYERLNAIMFQAVQQFAPRTAVSANSG